MRPTTSLAWLAAVAFLGAVTGTPSAPLFSQESGQEARDAELASAAIWDAFVEHLKGAGREDLLHAGENGVHEEDGPASDEDQSPGAHEHPLPDLTKGDPILRVLFHMSSDLVNLHALFSDEERARFDDAERAARVEDLVAKLGRADDPYVREYGEFLGARFALERGNFGGAAVALEKLSRSPRFLSKGDVHRYLAVAYRGRGEETLAILELQFFLRGLAPESTSDRLWAQDELKKIREHHEGPLHDCADRAKKLASLIAMKEVGEPTQGEQRQVEDILEKIATLLEDQANRCPECGGQRDQTTGKCQSSCKSCGACTAGRGSGSSSSSASQGKGGTSPGTCPECGGQLAQGPGGNGNPQGAQAQGGPAEDTRIQAAKAAEANLREATDAEKEAWGRINDRDVARSLRKLWGKIPPSYRRLVADYYKDITDLVADDAEGR